MRQRERTERRSVLSRYDLVLAAIPLCFATAALLHLGLGVPLAAALVPSAFAGGLLLADAVFLHPPTSPPSDGN